MESKTTDTEKVAPGRDSISEKPAGAPASVTPPPTVAAGKSTLSDKPAGPVPTGSVPSVAKPAVAKPETVKPDAARAATASEPPRPATKPTPAPAPTPAPQKSGFGGTVLGGIVAAGIGAAAAVFVLPQIRPAEPSDEMVSMRQGMNEQSTRIADLSAQVSTLGVARDVKDLAAQTEEGLARLSDQVTAIGARIDAAETQFKGLDERITALEKRPVQDGAASASALEAFGREMDAMRKSFAEDQKQIQAAAQAVADRLAEAEAEAKNLRAQTDAEAGAAMARVALNRIKVALDSGSAFDDSLPEIEKAGLDVPAPLADQAGGVPTLRDLRASFPPAARAALDAARRAELPPDADAMSRFTAFLKSQSGARSLAPREGNDPDAVLSRAEAALDAGDLAGAVGEVRKLPQEAQNRMADWLASAEKRLSAVQAVDELAGKLG